MRWTVEQEKLLLDLVKENKSLEDISKALRRSEDAVRMKLRRMGLPAPEKCREKKLQNKVTDSTRTTTTPKLEPVKFKDLPSPNEALGLLWAALKRLQQPDITKEETRKLRLIISGVKSYIHLEADYVLRIREVERRMLSMLKTELVHLQYLADHESNTQEKAMFEAEIKKVQEEIAKMETLGIRETRKQKKELKHDHE